MSQVQVNMADTQNEDVELPNVPKKLANRINELDKEEPQVDEPLIDLDKIQLTSAHPVSVVKFSCIWANQGGPIGPSGTSRTI